MGIMDMVIEDIGGKELCFIVGSHGPRLVAKCPCFRNLLFATLAILTTLEADSALGTIADNFGANTMV